MCRNKVFRNFTKLLRTKKFSRRSRAIFIQFIHHPRIHKFHDENFGPHWLICDFFFILLRNFTSYTVSKISQIMSFLIKLTHVKFLRCVHQNSRPVQFLIFNSINAREKHTRVVAWISRVLNLIIII